MGDRIALVALAFAVLEIGGSARTSGRVLAAGVFLWWRRPWRAEWSRPYLAPRCDGGRGPGAGGEPGTISALLIAGGQVWMLAVLAGVTRFAPAPTGLLPEVVLSEQLQPANALRASAVSTGEILGLIVGGVLVAAAGAGWVIAIDAATFAFSAACLALLQVPARAAAEATSA